MTTTLKTRLSIWLVFPLFFICLVFSEVVGFLAFLGWLLADGLPSLGSLLLLFSVAFRSLSIGGWLLRVILTHNGYVRQWKNLRIFENSNSLSIEGPISSKIGPLDIFLFL